MKTLLAISFAFSLTCICAAAEFDPFEGPKPLMVFIQSDPWAMVIGSDTPRVAIYENGDLIFVKKAGNRPAYRHVTLDKAGLDKVRVHIQPVLALKDLKRLYNIRPDATDQPESRFYFCDAGRDVATSVYGLMAGNTELPGYTVLPTDKKPTLPPQALLKLHQWLCEFDRPGSTEWTPKYVEVMLWDYSYAPEASIQWPTDWPSLKSDRAVKRGKSYSIFLDGSLIPKLREFLATRKERGAIEVDGKKMAASYRFTFPGEPRWRKAFDAAVETERNLGDKRRD
jgi:hypothetical protein